MPEPEGMQRVREQAERQRSMLGTVATVVGAEGLPRFAPDLPRELAPARRAELEQRVAELEPWLQGPFVLSDDLVIGGTWRNDHRWSFLEQHVPDLAGLRVLDIGSNAGYDPFMFKLKGAEHVLACEPFEFIEQAQFLESIYRTGIDFRRIGWQQLDPGLHGRFDVVHCHGVLYHEPDPIGLLQRLRAMLADDGLLLFGSLLHGSSERSEYIRFVPDAYAGDPTWWFVPGRLAMRWMLEVTGFATEELMISAGVAGEFPTVTSYFRGRPAQAAAELTPVTGGLAAPMRFPAGHYYSPMYDVRELASERARLWPSQPRATPDIEWREDAQLELCQRVFGARDPLALRREPSDDPTEYWADNDQYPALDAWVLAGLLRHLRPARMIEVGSGFSSLVSARVNREELGREMRFTCIEPYPRDFLIAGVPGIDDLRQERIQDTPLELFDELGDGDVLFIDTSHTVKTGGDVTWLFGEVLPRLAPGVHVHVHDIFLPGEYPEAWVTEAWGWNETYLVRSFLSYNAAFEVVWGAQFMLQRHPDVVLATFPGQREYAHRGGASLWMRRAR